MTRHRLQAALGGGHDAAHAIIMLNGHAQCAPKGLEHGFNLVMRIHAAQIVDVQGDLGVIDEALEKLHEQVNIKSANT